MNCKYFTTKFVDLYRVSIEIKAKIQVYLYLAIILFQHVLKESKVLCAKPSITFWVRSQCFYFLHWTM